MWLFTKYGFYSVVQDYEHQGNVLVRSRRRADLNRLKSLALPAWIGDVVATPDRDYPYRVTFPRDIFMSVIMPRLGASVDYPNFKDAAAKGLGTRVAATLARIWLAGISLEIRARPVAVVDSELPHP